MKIVDICRSKCLNPWESKRTVYNIDSEYEKFQKGQPNKLIEALRDPNAVLVMSRDTHGFIELAAQDHPELFKALYDKLPDGGTAPPPDG